MKNQKLNFALIGCGRIGARHAEHIDNIGILKAVCDTDDSKAIQFGDRFSCASYNDMDELLAKEKNMDVVSICTPNGLHSLHTIKALRKGFHVLVEKPMAISVFDCGEMIKEAEKANKLLFIVKQNRFNPPIVAVKKLIENNTLGKIFSVQLNCFWNRSNKYYQESNWKGTKKMDGGILFTQFSHFIDLLYWFFGDVKEVKSYLGNFNHKEIIEFEDTGVAILKFYSGIIATSHFTINSYAKNMEGSLTIFAEKGTIKIGGQYLNELEYQMIDGEKIISVDKGNPPNNYGEYTGSMSNHADVYKNIVDVLGNNGIIATSGYEGLKTVEIINKIYESYK